MKQETSIDSSTNFNSQISPSQNKFLNVILVLLGLIVVYLIYSLILNFNNLANQKESEAEKNKMTKIIQLEVLNGCGTEGTADSFTGLLRENNFDVVRSGNYRSFDLDYSLVIDRTGNITYANIVAECLGIDEDHIIQQLSDTYFLDVTLIIGKDFNSLRKKTEIE